MINKKKIKEFYDKQNDDSFMYHSFGILSDEEIDKITKKVLK